MPFSNSFSDSFNKQPISIGQLTEWLNTVLGTWNVGLLTEEFLALFPYTIGDLNG